VKLLLFFKLCYVNNPRNMFVAVILDMPVVTGPFFFQGFTIPVYFVSKILLCSIVRVFLCQLKKIEVFIWFHDL
jgi:hypothetical protein